MQLAPPACHPPRRSGRSAQGEYQPNDEECVERLERQFVQSNNACGKQVAEAVQDAYKRLLKPSIETEFAAQSKERADDEPSASLRKTCGSCCWHRPWGRKG